MTSTKTEEVQKEMIRVFQQFGLPKTIHVDNGPPFASTQSRLGLSRLSVWWVSLGISVSFSRPGTPSDNGGHERMHRDIAVELQPSPSANLKAQQKECDRWVEEFNRVRPHEALGMETPHRRYRRSTRRCQKICVNGSDG
jgi:transposase InsO family protein